VRRGTFTVWASLDIVAGRSLRPWRDADPPDDPVAVALALCAAGARRLHVADLDAARSSEAVNRGLLLEVARISPCPVQVSGGLRSSDEVGAVLAAGAERAVLSPAALGDVPALRSTLQSHPERVAALLDLRSGRVGAGIPLPDAVRLLEDAGVAAFIVTDLAREGTMSGPGLESLRAVAGLARVPVVAAGGIGTVQDLAAVRALEPAGVTGAIVGRSLYEGRITLDDLNREADGPEVGVI
jgi:phosphoribosylformimino-5-aminoimidazole carboxamide ribotide isomerase